MKTLHHLLKGIQSSFILFERKNQSNSEEGITLNKAFASVMTPLKTVAQSSVNISSATSRNIKKKNMNKG